MDGKTNEWRNQAHEIVVNLAHNNGMLVSDMVVTELEAAGLGLDNYSVLGGVFNRAAKDGLIEKTDITQQSTRARSKSAKTVWRSLVYTPADQSKEQSVINSLLVAALDFNAETIRLASLVFAGGQMDQKAYASHINEFNKISDKYVSRQAKVLESIGQEF